MTVLTPTNRMLVEGRDEVFAVVNLMRAHGVNWPQDKGEWPAVIQDCGGISVILEADFISTVFQSSGVKNLGIVIDANDDFASRWRQLRDRCLSSIPDIPETMPTDGLIRNNADGKRLGIWIMPDNSSAGMLENFLQHLVPAGQEPLWQFASSSTAEARSRGAPYRTAHEAKARIHAWLAWQDPPGQPFGTAMTQKILDVQLASSAPFVAWFRKLYEI
jgi:hypothetical protein